MSHHEPLANLYGNLRIVLGWRLGEYEGRRRGRDVQGALQHCAGLCGKAGWSRVVAKQVYQVGAKFLHGRYLSSVYTVAR